MVISEPLPRHPAHPTANPADPYHHPGFVPPGSMGCGMALVQGQRQVGSTLRALVLRDRNLVTLLSRMPNDQHRVCFRFCACVASSLVRHWVSPKPQSWHFEAAISPVDQNHHVHRCQPLASKSQAGPTWPNVKALLQSAGFKSIEEAGPTLSDIMKIESSRFSTETRDPYARRFRVQGLGVIGFRASKLF